jgi:hypothetical protein
MTCRVFREPREGYVAHTATSAVLFKDQQMNDWSGLNLDEFFPAAANAVEAMKRYPGSQEPNETAFSIAHCPGQPMFATISKDPTRAKRFSNAMESLTGGEGYEIKYMVDNYPWKELDEKGGLIVDVSTIDITMTATTSIPTFCIAPLPSGCKWPYFMDIGCCKGFTNPLPRLVAPTALSASSSPNASPICASSFKTFPK